MFSPALEVVLHIAFREAVSRRHAYLTLEHLLYALAHDPDGERILFSRDRDIALLDTRTGSVHDVLPRGSVPGGVWQKFALSRDGRRLTWVEPYEEGDLWMMALAR